MCQIESGFYINRHGIRLFYEKWLFPALPLKGIIQIAHVEMYKQHGIQNASYLLYRGGRHEMLRETNRSEIFRDIVNWLNSTKVISSTKKY